MSKCKWCEKKLPNDEDPKIYCDYKCEGMYHNHGMRKSLFDFAQAMEKSMQEKDKLGYENKIKSIRYLEDKLHEERNEVDECFIQSSTFFNTNSNQWLDKFINEESLHEGIMLALLRHRLIEEQVKLTNEDK